MAIEVMSTPSPQAPLGVLSQSPLKCGRASHPRAQRPRPPGALIHALGSLDSMLVVLLRDREAGGDVSGLILETSISKYATECPNV